MASTFSVCSQCDTLNKVDSDQALQKSPTCGKCGSELPMHGLVSEVSGKNLKRILAKSAQPVIVDFWASWCGPCKMYGPIFERASVVHKNAVFVKVNTEEAPQLSAELGIRGIPTTIVFRNGKEFTRQPGVIPEEAIGQLVR